jgi:hypothetical protein
MKKLMLITLIFLAFSSCKAQDSTYYQKTVTEDFWKDGYGPAMPYHVKIIASDFWYEINWTGTIITIRSSIPKNYWAWSNDDWCNIINYCYVDREDLKIIKL